MSKPIPVKLDKPLLDRIVALSQKIGEAQSTVMRMAMRIGLDGLEKAFEANPADLLKLLTGLEAPKNLSSSNSAQETNPSEQKLQGTAPGASAGPAKKTKVA